MSRFGIFKINGVEYDMDDLTLDEIEKLEDINGGVPFSEMNYGSAKAMKAIAFVLISRTDPNVTLEDVGSVKVIDFAPSDEEMPTLPPGSTATDLGNGSSPDASGIQDSAVSTTG